MINFNHKKIILIFAAMTIAIHAWPYMIKGRLMSGDTPVPGIEVRISDKEGTGLGNATTDRSGAFTVGDIGEPSIVVNATGCGYEPLRIDVVTDGTDTDLGIISLTRSVDLGEVIVTAKARIDTPGKTVVYVSQTEKERAAGPFNMLTILSYKAPQIKVKESDRTLTIDGEEPEILVNGVRRNIAFISSIKPDAIERIEFSPTPDVRFGKRYLNIITRRPEEGGWVMADMAGAITTPRYFLNGVAEYTRGKNDVMFYYTGGYRHGTREYEDEEERYIGGGRDITLSVEGRPSSTKDRYHNLYLYYTHVPSEKSMLVATASLNLHDNDREVRSLVTDLTKTYDRVNERGYSLIRPNLSLYYNFKASDRATIEIDAVGSYSDNSSHRNLTYSTGYNSRVTSKSHVWYFSAEALWRHTLPFGQLNTGISFSHNDASSRYKIDGERGIQPLSSTNLRAYSSLGGSLISISYLLSAAMVYSKVNEGMVSPDLTATLQRRFGNYINLSYNFRYTPQMPSASSYNEMVTPVNDLLYSIGVDKLSVQHNLSNDLQISYNKDRLYLSIRGMANNTSRPLMTEYRYQDDPSAPLYGYFLQQPGNGRSLDTYSVDLNVGVSNLWNFLSISASTGWGHRCLVARETFTLGSWHLGMSLGLYWKGWQLNFTGSNLVPSKSIWGVNDISRRWPYTSLAIYKRLGRWNLQMSWTNMFNRYGGRHSTETWSSVSPRYSEFRMNDQGNLVEIGVRYDFTFGRLMAKKSRGINLSGGGDSGVSLDF